MAQLSPLIQFTAGTPAVADDVNSNFTAIRSHINSANIDTENIAATLTSRVGGPILFLDQASQNEIAFSVQNSQTNTAMQILQSAQLAVNKSVIKLKDTYPQTVGKAELWLELATGSTIPALLVEHGADVSMSLTKTQLNLFNSAVQATSAGILSATTVSATTVNATNVNTTGQITATAPVGDAIALKVKGRNSDNNAVIQFKSSDDSTVYASITSSPTSLAFNLPDTADSYIFDINGSGKAVINNSGINGQYIYNISPSSINQFPILFSTTFNYVSNSASDIDLWTSTFTTTKANAYIQVTLEPINPRTSRYDTNGTDGSIDPGQLVLNATASSYNQDWFNVPYSKNIIVGTNLTFLQTFGPIPIARSYSLTARAYRSRGGGFATYGTAIVDYRFVIRQIV